MEGTSPPAAAFGVAETFVGGVMVSIPVLLRIHVIRSCLTFGGIVIFLFIFLQYSFGSCGNPRTVTVGFDILISISSFLNFEAPILTCRSNYTYH